MSYLARQITQSSYNNKGTISFWTKQHDTVQQPYFSLGYNAGGTDMDQIDVVGNSAGHIQFEQYGDADQATRTNYYVRDLTPEHRDLTGWMHVLVTFDMDLEDRQRAQLYINGRREDVAASSSAFTNTWVMPWRAGGLCRIMRGVGITQYASDYGEAELSDYFVIDGVSLQPEDFGYRDTAKQGEWRPKHPRIIKNTIQEAGGFGPNGFYLPLNCDVFGADFSRDPNSIVLLNENLPQPNALVYNERTDIENILREDPFGDDCVLALPFISSSQDYSGYLNGSNSNQSVGVSNLTYDDNAVYYGRAASFNGTNTSVTVDGTDFDFGANDFCIEMWFAPTAKGVRQNLVWDGNSGGSDLSGSVFFEITSANLLRAGVITTGTYSFGTGTTVLDDGSWYHVALTREGNTCKVYLNGNLEVLITGNTGNVNTATDSMQFGGTRLTNDFTGYINDIRVYNGTSKYTGGFEVPRMFGATTHNKWRVSKSTPSNDFCTFNVLGNATDYFSDTTFSNGNLVTQGTAGSSAHVKQALGTIGVSSGKWYWEARLIASANFIMGFWNDHNTDSYPLKYYDIGYRELTSPSGNIESSDGTTGGSVGTWTNGDIVGCAIDFDAGSVTWYKNGSFQGSVTGIDFENYTMRPILGVWTSGEAFGGIANFGQNSTFSGNETRGIYTDANGLGEFFYEPPLGHLSICRANLPKPTVNPKEHFDVVTYTGNGSQQTISSLNFDPDLVWIKHRNSSEWNIWADTVRGAGNLLFSNNANAEMNLPQSVMSIDQKGFTVGADPDASTNSGWNKATTDIVAWCWRAGGAPVTNTIGSETSTVSANVDAGFSIVSYARPGASNYTIGHGLSRAPELIITKGRNAGSGTLAWGTYYTVDGTNANWVRLDTTDAEGGQTGTLANGAFLISNETTLEVGSNSFANAGSDMIAYCWHSVPGYSKVGIYLGNNTDTGPFVYTGFEPAFVMIKNISDVTSYASWGILDYKRGPGYNPIPGETILYANLQQVEGLRGQGGAHSGDIFDLDFLSNGFKIPAGNGSTFENNNNNAQYLYIAFAKGSINFSNGK